MEENMYELLQHLIALKYSCKINHWSTDDYSRHLLFDVLSEHIDDWVDKISERYFMAHDEKNVFKANILNPKFIDLDIPRKCAQIIEIIEKMIANEEVNQGMQSLLTDIESGLLNKLALSRL
jgi:DNA-binding ferritin-like protein